MEQSIIIIQIRGPEKPPHIPHDHHGVILVDIVGDAYYNDAQVPKYLIKSTCLVLSTCSPWQPADSNVENESRIKNARKGSFVKV